MGEVDVEEVKRKWLKEKSFNGRGQAIWKGQIEKKREGEREVIVRLVGV